MSNLPAPVEELYKSKYGECSKLNHTNYTKWKHSIEVFLLAENALQIVLGEEDAPAANLRSQLADYNLRKGRAIAIIYSSCTFDVQSYLHGISNPQEMWERLKEKLDTTASNAGRALLLREFHRTHPKENEPISTYFSALSRYRHLLAHTDQAITDETFIYHLISTLPKAFDNFVDIALDRPEHNAEHFINKILEAEKVLQSRQPDSGSSSNMSSTSGNALRVQTNYRGSGNSRGRGNGRGDSRSRSHSRNPNRYQSYGGGRSRSSSSSPLCWYCGAIGHVERDCHVKERGERARRRGGFRRGSGGGPGGGPGRSDGNPSAGAAFTTVQALAAFSDRHALVGSQYDTTNQWIVDSGASHHICPNRRLFTSFKRLSKPIQIHLGDNSTILATGTGTIRLLLGSQRYIDIKDVLFAPRCHLSLLSVGMLSTEFSVRFTQGTCYISRASQSTEVLLARLHDGLYRLAGQPIQSSATTIQVNSASTSPSLELWHQRLGHLGATAVKSIVGDSVSGQLDLCPVCVKAKHQRKVIRKPVPHTTAPFQLIHSDLCGPLPVPSVSGARYFILYIDDYSRRAWVYLLRGKEAIEVVSRFQEFKAYIEKQYPQWPITRFRCDNGKGEYDNRLFRGILRVSGISFEPSPPYTQHKNGVSERMIRTIVTKARAMLIDAQLPSDLWAEAVDTAVYLHERSPSSSINGKSPYEMLHGEAPDLSHLRRFGCQANKLIPKEQRVDKKFGPRSLECIMIGYVHDTQKIWRIWDPVGRRAVQASDVIFDESKIVSQWNGQEEALKMLLPEEVIEVEDKEPGSCVVPVAEQDEVARPVLSRESVVDVPQASTAEEEERTENSDIVDASKHVSMDSSGARVRDTQAESLMPTDAQSRPPRSYIRKKAADEVTPPENPTLRRSTRKRTVLAMRANSEAQEDPTRYEEAVQHESWKMAMREEYASLQTNKTWVYCDEKVVPAGRKVIGCKWVYKTKRKPDGSIRYKARLVIKGYEQVEGLDFGETFAPVAKLTSLRMILALAAQYDWLIDQMDVVTAFLNPEIDEEVYMEVPNGIDWLDPDISTDESFSTPVCCLKKALYGLKQAPRLWFQNIDSFLKTLGFNQSTADPNIYVSAHALILLYVDDILIVSQSRRQLDLIKQQLLDRYRMTDLGAIQQFLGLEISIRPDVITLRQTCFIDTILQRFAMADCYGQATPMESKLQLFRATDDSTAVQPREYQALIGSLMYLMLGSRPDLAFTVSTLSKFNANPTMEHLTAAKRVLRYLQYTRNLSLVYSRTDANIRLQGFTDSDWAGCKEDRKSTSGYVFTLTGAAISWKSRKQETVSLSSTEAEYIACSETAKEAIWLRRLLDELQSANSTKSPQIIYADNQSSMKLAQNPRFHDRTKHIDIKHHFIREACEKGLIDLSYLPTGDMTADILTKALSKDLHWRHTHGMGLKDPDRISDLSGSTHR